jgi:hypothetical protein
MGPWQQPYDAAHRELSICYAGQQLMQTRLSVNADNVAVTGALLSLRNSALAAV